MRIMKSVLAIVAVGATMLGVRMVWSRRTSASLAGGRLRKRRGMRRGR